MPKRARNNDGTARATGTGYTSKRAAAVNARVKSKFPYASYGASYSLRGTPENLARYGPTFKGASAEQRSARRAVGYYGKGDYKAFLRGASRGIGALGGGALGWMKGGGPIGAVSGAKAGWDTGAKVSKYFGWGDYGGSAGGNQIMAGSVDTPMRVNASADLTGDVYISHREFITNVTATGGSNNISPFQISPYPLNAGLQSTFPWLAQIAQNFTLYELQGCIFEFKPTSGELGATGTNSLGKVIFATQYDPDAPAFINSVQMENYDYANACKPSEHLMHGVETAEAQRATNILYTRTGTSNKSKVFTDIGTLYVATEGLPIQSGVNAQIGELWVSYRVKLSRAQLYGTIMNNNILQDSFLGYTGTGLFTGTPNFLAANPTIANVYAAPNASSYACARKSSTIGGSLEAFSASAMTYTFAAQTTTGLYRVMVWLTQAPAAANSVISISNFVGCAQSSPIGITTAAGGLYQSAPSAATGTTAMATFYVLVNSPNNVNAGFRLTFANAPAANSIIVVDVEEQPMAILP